MSNKIPLVAKSVAVANPQLGDWNVNQSSVPAGKVVPMSNTLKPQFSVPSATADAALLLILSDVSVGALHWPSSHVEPIAHTTLQAPQFCGSEPTPVRIGGMSVT